MPRPAAPALTVEPEPQVLAFSADMRPVGTVRPGDVVVFRTLDCCAGDVRSEDQLVPMDGHDVAAGGGNPAAGPVAVEGAEPGDTLVVTIREIRLQGSGLALVFPGYGPLGSRVAAPETRLFELAGDEGRRGRLVAPLRPMIGVIGVAPAEGRVSTELVGEHGGNLDDRFAGAGARVLLPVRQPGAMLALGDVHAAMGDGELSASAIEAAAEVTVEVGLIRGRQARWPIVETAAAWCTHGVAADLDGAVRLACEDAAALLESEWGLSATDAVFHLSAAGDAGICQCAQPSPFPAVARMAVLRTPTAPAPFSCEEAAWPRATARAS